MNIAVETDGRRHRLKAATNATHERLDARIMASGAFSSREGYGRFALMQHGFHRDINALYSDAALDRLLPDLAGRRRLGQIAQDLADLGSRPGRGRLPLFSPRPKSICRQRSAGSMWPKDRTSAPRSCWLRSRGWAFANLRGASLGSRSRWTRLALAHVHRGAGYVELSVRGRAPRRGGRRRGIRARKRVGQRAACSPRRRSNEESKLVV